MFFISIKLQLLRPRFPPLLIILIMTQAAYIIKTSDAAVTLVVPKDRVQTVSFGLTLGGRSEERYC